jgi:muconolactone delta-isomerase
LEFGSESESEIDMLEAPISAPELEDEYQLPRLPKPPSSYDEYAFQLDDIHDKVLDTLSSLPRRRYTITINIIKEYLMRGSLYELEIQ